MTSEFKKYIQANWTGRMGMPVKLPGSNSLFGHFLSQHEQTRASVITISSPVEISHHMQYE